MYSVPAYGKMINDSVRMAAYEAAMQRAIKPGMVVLDIGTGTGIHALMAARLGASHVYAVEPADSVTLAPTVARQNGFDGVISFIQDLSTRIDLPQRADMIISDLHGTLPWYHHHIPTIVDARRRLLKPGGTLIPQRDTVFAAAVEAPDLYAPYSAPWRQRPFGFDMSYVSTRITNIYSRGRVGRDGFLTEIQRITELDYATIDDPNVHVVLELTPLRAGTMHGFVIWFDTDVFDDVRLTSAPFEPEISYGSSFFPLTNPVDVQPGDRIRFEWRGVLQDSYLWIWNCDVVGADGEKRASYRQNSMNGAFLSMDALAKRAPAYRPRLGREGKIDRAILNLMEEDRSLTDIARELRASFSDAFTSEADALDRVRSLSQRYG